MKIPLQKRNSTRIAWKVGGIIQGSGRTISSDFVDHDLKPRLPTRFGPCFVPLVPIPLSGRDRQIREDCWSLMLWPIAAHF